MAIGAHPDDVEIFCGGTLAKYKKQGGNIFIALATSGDKGTKQYSPEETARIREAEQVNAAKLTDAQVRFMRFGDQELCDTPELRKELMNSIRWANPDVILTHSPCDRSTDHSVLGEVVSRIMLSINSINYKADLPPVEKFPSLFFWDTFAGVGFTPEVYVDISNEMDLKRKAFMCHISQMAFMGQYCSESDFQRSIEIMSGFRGLQYGVNYAEAFTGFKLQGFVADYRLLP